MTTLSDSHPLTHDPTPSNVYDPDEVCPQNSPLMQALRPKLKLSPSPPPAIPLPRVPPSQGDAVLIHYLDGGKRPDIAFEAGSRPLAAYADEDYDDEDDRSESSSGTSAVSGDEDRYIGSPTAMSPDARPTEPPSGGSMDLKLLAAGAVARLTAQSPPSDAVSRHSEPERPHRVMSPISPRLHESLRLHQQPQSHALAPPQRSTVSQGTKPVLAPPMSPYTPSNPQDAFSPRQPPPGHGLRHPGDVNSPVTGLPTPSHTTPGHGELPPLQMASPRSESNALPPIREQLGKQLNDHPGFADKEHAMRLPPTPSFPHSPPTTASHRMSIISAAHSSPPISPNYSYTTNQGMPSPAHTLPLLSPYGFSPNSSNFQRPGLDYTSSSNNETPNTDMGSTPAPATSIMDRMSIDSMTNPQTGSFVCRFHGCTAAPFQTQYLLNSHANVHSSARPHYCPVKGCPRSEGGKGFKRKNEMIRHGLVHDSPGYVCPFCPDREHKYPRPDNLQRHVRVHHVDKDKDDPMLRDVLSQRPDGPNRGRRRRGA